MPKILIIKASGRQNAITSKIADEFALASETSEKNKVEEIDIHKLNFKPCIGCMSCRSSKKCIFSGDDADLFGQKIQQADLIVIAAPVYWGNMPGLLKALFDRNVFCMMDENRFGIPVPLLKGKKAVIITACTTPFPFNILCRQTSGVAKALKEILGSSGIKIISCISVPGTKFRKELFEKMKKSIKAKACKIVKKLAVFIMPLALPVFLAVQAPVSANAQEAASTETEKSDKPKTSIEKGWGFSAVTDFAYYPKSDFKKGGTHFAPVTSLAGNTEMRTTLHAAYTVPFSFSNNPLFEGCNFSVDTALELTPISIMPKLKFSITPAAFFNFQAGANIGTAWELTGIKSLSWYNSTKVEYEQMNAFETWYYQMWICSTLMFDTAAIFPGDWNHIVMAASWELNYAGLLNEDSECDLFQWQTADGQTEGAKYVSSYLIGYQMPLKLSLIGVQAEFSGYMHKSDFADKYDKYEGDFMKVSVNPLCQIDLSEKDSIFLLARISSRRSFKEKHTKTEQEPLLTKSGREWIFDCVACSWTHKF